MGWYGLVDQETGGLVSVGTEAMFVGGDPQNAPAGFDAVAFEAAPAVAAVDAAFASAARLTAGTAS